MHETMLADAYLRSVLRTYRIYKDLRSEETPPGVQASKRCEVAGVGASAP